METIAPSPLRYVAMPTTKRRSPNSTVIVLDGDYDLARQEELRHEFAAMTLFEVVQIDMRKVISIDATALAEFVRLKERMLGFGIVRIVGATPHVQRLFHITGLDTQFEMHDSLGSATVSFLSSAPAP